MSLSVKNITKIYNEQKAIDQVSFELKAGEIVGFLGPNGAGKTTTVKIISCFIPPTEGTVSVCGLDVAKDPLKVKKKIGYLPENNPLYYDMYVKEFLNFIASLHKLNLKKGVVKKERINEMIELVGLENEQHKKIGTLSKGFKQRVGLAQAMIHDPEVLILDEPTSGLDPNQLIEIRELIKNFGKDKTVLLSTHIMQEVESLCDRIIIINQGKIVADDTVDAIQENYKQSQVFQVEFNKEIDQEELLKINNISKVKKVTKHTWLIESDSGKDLRTDIAEFAAKNEILILTLQKETDKLEDIFKILTK